MGEVMAGETVMMDSPVEGIIEGTMEVAPMIDSWSEGTIIETAPIEAAPIDSTPMEQPFESAADPIASPSDAEATRDEPADDVPAADQPAAKAPKKEAPAKKAPAKKNRPTFRLLRQPRFRQPRRQHRTAFSGSSGRGRASG